MLDQSAVLKKELRSRVNSQNAVALGHFFKTNKGEYGYGDVFIGVSVPQIRVIASKYKNVEYEAIIACLCSSIHEERLLALILLVNKFIKGTPQIQDEVYTIYMKYLAYINNWDLVDVSAEKILGAYLVSRSKDILYKLARSQILWERRIAIVATFYFIKQGKYTETYKVATLLLSDTHDLIHKAVGWMLREVGKRCGQETEESFLKDHYKVMPRTMLRYAIEHFPPEKRRNYLEGIV